MSTPPIEFWFDFSCPYAYLASRQLSELERRTGAPVALRPFLLGGVFRARAVPQNLASTLVPAKARHNLLDIQRHARLQDAPLRFPEGHPIRTVTALRCMLVVGEPFGPLMHRFFAAYWEEGIDIGRDEGVAAVLTAAGHDAAAVLEAAAQQGVKDQLRERTDEGLSRGIFGAPSFVVNGQLYWGQDRLEEVAQAAGATLEPPVPADDYNGHTLPVDLYFDYSSPFSYLGASRAQHYFGDALRWRPMLLGAVFKSVGTANVPLFAMSEAKRDFQNRDIQRQALAAGIELRWPDHFPLNTVLALRVTLLAGGGDTEAGRALVAALYRACWVEGRDPSKSEVVAAIADGVGLDGSSLVEAASQPPAKQALRDTTAEAVEAGVFGAPTFVVRPPGRPAELFWGNDRLELALAAARGDERLWGALD